MIFSALQTKWRPSERSGGAGGPGSESACLRRTLCVAVFPAPGSPNPILRLDYQLTILSGRCPEPFLCSFQRLSGPIFGRILRFKNMDAVLGGVDREGTGIATAKGLVEQPTQSKSLLHIERAPTHLEECAL